MRQLVLTHSFLLVSAVAINGTALAGENPQSDNLASVAAANVQLDGNNLDDGGENEAKTIVRAKGKLEPREFIELRNQVGTSMMITWLVPEGTTVRDGDLIVEFDDSILATEADNKKMLAMNSRADLLDAESALIALNSDYNSACELAKQKLLFAEKDQKRQLAELERALAGAKRQLGVAEQKLKLSQERLQSLRSSQTATGDSEHELNLQIISAQVSVEDAREKTEMLDGPEREYRKDLATLNVREAELSLERIESNFKLQEANAKAGLQLKKEKLDLAEQLCENIKQQLEACQVFAPQSGKVEYVRVQDRRGNYFEIRPGAIIRDRQAVARLPNMEQLQLGVMIEEAEIMQIQTGQPARILFDALPDRIFEGKVVHITTYASPTSLGGPTVRQYEVTVSLDNRPDDVQLGMTANVEIVTSDD